MKQSEKAGRPFGHKGSFIDNQMRPPNFHHHHGMRSPTLEIFRHTQTTQVQVHHAPHKRLAVPNLGARLVLIVIYRFTQHHRSLMHSWSGIVDGRQSERTKPVAPVGVGGILAQVWEERGEGSAELKSVLTGSSRRERCRYASIPWKGWNFGQFSERLEGGNEVVLRLSTIESRDGRHFCGRITSFESLRATALEIYDWQKLVSIWRLFRGLVERYFERLVHVHGVLACVGGCC